jgi:hypothetical protein
MYHYTKFGMALILGASSAFQATLHDDVHCVFVTLPLYSSTREETVQPLVSRVMRQVGCLVERVGPA